MNKSATRPRPSPALRIVAFCSPSAVTDALLARARQQLAHLDLLVVAIGAEVRRQRLGRTTAAAAVFAAEAAEVVTKAVGTRLLDVNECVLHVGEFRRQESRRKQGKQRRRLLARRRDAGDVRLRLCRHGLALHAPLEIAGRCLPKRRREIQAVAGFDPAAAALQTVIIGALVAVAAKIIAPCKIPVLRVHHLASHHVGPSVGAGNVRVHHGAPHVAHAQVLASHGHGKGRRVLVHVVRR
mmetsp:Transcript_106592/g.306632  ORF Transcript_106592/g.306632 Transcript_106592/m.306632 type:complete len:240 (-) Transcript_106592:1057-1776(-)